MAPPLLFVAISLLSPCSAWSQPGATPAWPQPCTGFEFVSRGPSLTPSLSASPVLAFPASLVDYNSIWRLIYLHNRYRVPSMCQALARSWGTTNPTVGLFCFIRWKGEVERILPHTYYTHTHTYYTATVHTHTPRNHTTHTPYAQTTHSMHTYHTHRNIPQAPSRTVRAGCPGRTQCPVDSRQREGSEEDGADPDHWHSFTP